jgi:hypothetical protein
MLLERKSTKEDLTQNSLSENIFAGLNLPSAPTHQVLFPQKSNYLNTPNVLEGLDDSALITNENDSLLQDFSLTNTPQYEIVTAISHESKLNSVPLSKLYPNEVIDKYR